MQDLLQFLLKGILGEEKFEITESKDGERTVYSIKTDPKNIGMIIGKSGRIIKTLRNIIKVRATLEKVIVSLNIEEQV